MAGALNPVILMPDCGPLSAVIFVLPNTVIMKDEEKASSNDYGFPPGCFVLHSVSSGRMLDVCSDSIQDGTPVILWPEKDNSLVEGKLLLAYDTLHTRLTGA